MYGGASGGDEIEASCVRSLLHNELGWFDISPSVRIVKNELGGQQHSE